MSPISALQRLWRAVRSRPQPAEPYVPGLPIMPSYADFVALWPDLTVTECAVAAGAWEGLSPAYREWAYAVAARRSIGRKGAERFGVMKRFLSEHEFKSVPVNVWRGAGLAGEILCIALFVAMVWTWAAIGAGA